MVHSWAANGDDPTGQPRWRKIGKQKIQDAGELCPKRMETVDDETLDKALKFVDKARKDNKPFFLWLDPTRKHVVTHLSPKYQGLRNSENDWTIQEAGIAQIDDIVGSAMKYLKDKGLEGDTIIGFTTDNGAENFTWPDGGHTPFAGGKGTALEGGFRVPMIVRWPGKVPAGKVDCPILTNLRSDPYEGTGIPNGANGSLAYYNWFLYEFWRFQFVQKNVAKVAQTAIEFPPMRRGASFNLEAVKAQIEKARAAAHTAQ